MASRAPRAVGRWCARRRGNRAASRLLLKPGPLGGNFVEPFIVDIVPFGSHLALNYGHVGELTFEEDWNESGEGEGGNDVGGFTTILCDRHGGLKVDDDMPPPRWYIDSLAYAMRIGSQVQE